MSLCSKPPLLVSIHYGYLRTRQGQGNQQARPAHPQGERVERVRRCVKFAPGNGSATDSTASRKCNRTVWLLTCSGEIYCIMKEI